MFVGQTKKKVDIKNIRPHTLREEEVFGKKTSKKLEQPADRCPAAGAPRVTLMDLGKKRPFHLLFFSSPFLCLSLSGARILVPSFLRLPPSPPLFLPGKRSGATFTQFPRTKKSSYAGLGVALFLLVRRRGTRSFSVRY